MAKQTQLKQVTDRAGSATATVMELVEAILPWRSEGTPTVNLLAQLASQSARLLKLEKAEATKVQNEVVLGLMRKHELIAE